jgi:hypothetical protein
MAKKSPSGYFMAFDGDTGGEPGISFGRRQADGAEQLDAPGQKAKSGPANKSKATQRAIRPKQARSRPKPAAKTEQEIPNAPHDENEELFVQSPPAGTLARTKRLIMAALRVWELKQGIRE